MTPQETEQTRINYVRVTNGLPFTYTDRYDGVPFTLPPGKTDNLPPDMARHFFGFEYGADADRMMRHVARRQGWNTSDFVAIDPETGKTKAQAWFECLKIEPIAYKLVPANDPDPRQPIPADPEVPAVAKRGPGRPRLPDAGP